MFTDMAYTFLGIWFLVTFFYMCSWLIGNSNRDPKNVLNNQKMANILIYFTVAFLIFMSIAVFFLFFTGQLDLKFEIEILFGLAAMMGSLALFYLSLNPEKRV